MSLTRPSRLSPLSRMVSTKSRCSASSWSPLSISSPVRPMIALSGVRISWLMLARNSLLARVAASARSRAASSAWFEAASAAVRSSSEANDFCSSLAMR